MAIADHLLPRDVNRILSSRYVRCTQTVQPLADKLGLTIETHPAMAEEASMKDAWQLLEETAESGRESVLCSHGNILGALLDGLSRRGVTFVADEVSCRKGSIWTVHVDHGEIVSAVLTVAQA